MSEAIKAPDKPSAETETRMSEVAQVKKQLHTRREVLGALATTGLGLFAPTASAATWQSISGSGGFNAGPSNGRVDAVSSSCGAYTAMLLRSDGKVAGVGQNNAGMLGSSTPTTYTQLSAMVGGLSNVQSIASARKHALALLNDGTVYAVGSNDMGQLGISATADASNHPTPTQVLGMSNVVAIAAGGDDQAYASATAHSYFLKSDGTVWACGSSQYGRLGSGRNTGNYASPVQITEVSNIVAIAAGGYQGLFLRSDGAVYGVGYGADGRIGGSSNLSTATLISTVSTYPIVAVASGMSHSLFLSADGKVYSLGTNGSGRLGINNTTTKSVASSMTGITDAVAIAAGSFHSLVLRADGTVWACGENLVGQLGDGSLTNRSTCVQMLWQDEIVAMTAGFNSSYLLGADGNVKAVGLNSYYQLGDDTTTNRNVAVSLKTRWT